MTTETLYYVLRAGSTLEEQWSWQDIEAMLRGGDLTPSARIFLPDENRWALISETRLAGVRRPEGSGAPEASGDGGAEQAALEESYRAVLDRAAGEASPIAALLEAGALALDLGRRSESGEHFQKVLDLHPYHALAAQEIRRRFSAVEQRSFRCLNRPAPVWDDLGAVTTMPLARGPVYFLVPAAVFATLSFVPSGGFVTAAIAFLWAFQAMEGTARGARRPPAWDHALKDPLRRLARPALLMSTVLGGWALVFGAAGWLAMKTGGGFERSLWQYLSGSPVFVVAAATIAILYLPAAAVSLGNFERSAARTLDPRQVVRMVVRMEHEYVYTVLLLGVLAAAVAIVHALTSGLPVAGNVVLGLALAYAIPLAGLMMGRLLGRTGHVVS